MSRCSRIPLKWVLVVTGLSIWGIVTCFFLWKLLGYQTSPGQYGEPPKKWPVTTPLQLASDRHTLVMFVHPKCTCTRASIGEFSTILAKGKHRVSGILVISHPPSLPDDWIETDLLSSARAIPGVTIFIDTDQRQTAMFKIKTSGNVVLYNQHGDLEFNGGITASRSHYGDSKGKLTIMSYFLKEKVDVHDTLVFGCSLF